MKSMHSAAVMLGAVAIALTACGKKDQATMNSAGMAKDTMAMAPPMAPALTDPNIVFILDQASASDSARGNLASTKGTSGDVKDFGKLMMGEHHALREAGQALATKLSVTPMAPAGDQSEAMASQQMSTFDTMAKGKEWDKAYIDYEVTYHQAVLETATKALGAAQNQELKDLITKAAPTIQHHLDKALEIQKKLAM